MTRSSFAKAAVRVALGTGILLLLPLVAMRYTGDLSWGPEDFAAAAPLLFTAGMANVVAVRHVHSTTYHVVIAATVLVILALFWAELAVGLLD